MNADQRSPPLVLLALALLSIGALVVRLVGIGYMLPYHAEPDAVIVWQASYIERPAGEGMTDSSYPATYYPRLLARMLSVLPGHSYPQTLAATASVEEHMAAAAEPYLRARRLIAVLAALAVPATFFLARRFLSPGWSLFAAALMATSLLNTLYSQQARPHCASTSLSLLAMIPVLALVRSGSFGTYIAAGVLTGITLGCLQNGAFVVPALVLAHFVSPRRNWKGFVAALAIVAIAVLRFYWFLFQEPIVNSNGDLDIGGQTLNWSLVNGDGFRQMFLGFWSFEPVSCVAAAIGAAIGIARLVRRDARPDALALREVCVAAAFPLPFALAWGWMSVVQPRFVNPLIPYLCILGAFGASRVARWIAERIHAVPPRVAGIATGFALLAVPTYASVHLGVLRSRPSTIELATRWLEQHAQREKDRVLIETSFSVPLLERADGLATEPAVFHSPWERYQAKLPAEATRDGYRLRKLFRPGMRSDMSREKIRAIVDEEHAQYAIVVVPTARAVGLNFTRDGVRAVAGEPAYACWPYDPQYTELHGSAYELGFHGFARVWHSNSWGPPIEIYRLP